MPVNPRMEAEDFQRKAIEEANEAVAHAQSVRNRHAKKTRKGSPQRSSDIKIAKLKIHIAMHPIHKILCAVHCKAIVLEQELREASEALQRERRKLWKLKQRSTRKPKKPKKKKRKN